MQNKTKLTLLSSIALGIVSVLTIIAIATIPYERDRSGDTIIHIKKGDRLNVIANELKRKDLIRSRFFFKWFSIALTKHKNYKWGEYQINGNVSVMDLIHTLEQGNARLISITIPEGLRILTIAQLLKNAGFEDTDKHLKICRNEQFIKSLNLPIPLISLEGFLFPETYKFSKDESERTIVKAMVKTFQERIPKNFEHQANKIKLTYYEAIILASIIEKETGASEERELIASVFHNRLKRKMRLQTDPTVIYGIKNFNGNLTRRQLRTWTPYNTYVISGLPPTPIANPGLDSLHAAVNPADTKYLYFVAKGDGTHEFTTNYRDHKQAVLKYQKRRRKHYKSY